MTTQQFIEQQRAFIEEMSKTGRVFGQAVATVHGEIGQRIFQDGKAVDGAKIGTYSTKPGYYKMPGRAAGKFYDGGYKEFRQDVGRESGFVNLVLTSMLQNDWNTGLKKVSPVKYQSQLKNKDNQQKVADIEKKYSTEIFGISDAERNRIIELIERNMSI